MAGCSHFEDIPPHHFRLSFEVNGTYGIQIMVLSGAVCGVDACWLDQTTPVGGHRVPERRDQGAA
jgi:hypothetical protein